MPARTFTLSTGAKVRTETQSRFVLIGSFESFAKGPEAWIIKRSAKASVLRDEVRRRHNKGLHAPVFIGDTVTGEVMSA